MRALATLLLATALGAQCPYPGGPLHPPGVADIYYSCATGMGGCGLAALRLSLDREPVVGAFPRWTLEPFGPASPQAGAVVAIALNTTLHPRPRWLVPGTLCATFVPFGYFELHRWPSFPVGGVAVLPWWQPVLPVMRGLPIYAQGLVIDSAGLNMTQAVRVIAR